MRAGGDQSIRLEEMIEFSPDLTIDEQEIQFDFIRSPDPGGQNVNKVATAVQLRFNVLDSPSLPGEVKARLVRLAGRRITAGGELVIQASRYRSQESNRQDALSRLITLLRRAQEKPRPRKRTSPTAASRQRRLAEKRRRAEIKRLRRMTGEE